MNRLLGRRTLLTGGLASLASAGVAQPDRPNPETLTYDRLVEVSWAHAQALAAVAVAAGIGGGGQYAVDLETGIITWMTERSRITAPVQVVGTFVQSAGTWMWGWDHPSVPQRLRRDALLARAYGQRRRLNRYTTRLIEATEDDCWEMSAVTCYLADAQGIYRAEAENTRVFLTHDALTIEANDAA